MQESKIEHYETFTVNSIRKALRLCHKGASLSKLGRHPLANLKVVEQIRISENRNNNDMERGRSLRDVLFDAVKELRPDNKKPNYEDPIWFPYLSLKDQYFDHNHPRIVMEKLFHSRSSYYQKQNEVIEERLIFILMQFEANAPDTPNKKDRQIFYMVPKNPSYGLIGRKDLLTNIKNDLLRDGPNKAFAFVGLPGVGKTALAVNIARDPEIREAYSGGILWGKLGKNPEVMELLGEWGIELGVSPSELETLNKIENRFDRINSAIGERRMLIVIDDVWEKEAAHSLLVGDQNCSYVITTRSSDIAVSIAKSDRAITIPELSFDDSLVLLNLLAPNVIENWKDDIADLIRAYGGLPLGLSIMGNFLGIESHHGQSNRVHRAIEKLKDRTERLELAEVQSPIDIHPSLDKRSKSSLNTLISISYEALPKNGQKSLISLSVFPPKPNSFSVDAALAISEQSIEIIDSLTDYSLLESSGDERYSMHQTIFDYARNKLSDEYPFSRLVNYFDEFIINNVMDFDRVRLETINIDEVLRVAVDLKMFQAYVSIVNIYYFYLESRGEYKKASDLLNYADQYSRELHDPEGMVKTWINQGRLEIRKGNSDLARKLFSKSLPIAKELDKPELLCLVYEGRGILSGKRKNPDAAKDSLTVGLELARLSGSEDKICDLLVNLSTVNIFLDKLSTAESNLEEALLLAYENKYRSRLVKIFNNYATIADRRNDKDLSNAYLLEALDIARKIGFSLDQILVLSNLGAVAIDNEDYDLALDYLNKALPLAQQVNDPLRLSETLRNLGEVAGKTGSYEKSNEYFSIALETAEKLGDHQLISGILYEWGEIHIIFNNFDAAKSNFTKVINMSGVPNKDIADSKFGLGRSEKALGNYKEAQKLGEESLANLKEINDPRVKEVEEWLSEFKDQNGQFSSAAS